MADLVVSCIQVYDKRHCGVIQPILKLCVGCKWSDIDRKKLESPYICTALKRPCTITPPYGNFVGCIGCTHREPIREPKHE